MEELKRMIVPFESRYVVTKLGLGPQVIPN